MMNLPLNITQSYKLAPQNFVAQNLSLFDKLLENEKYVPMQFLFDKKAVWKVDLSLGSPTRPLSKISNLYVDALNSQHDVIIYFPDTGYEVHIAAGTVFLTPSLVSRGAYVFYVLLQGEIIDPTDLVNIFALNTNVPFFDSLWQYPTGKPTSSPSPTGSNISTWFYVGNLNVSFDNLYSSGLYFLGSTLVPASGAQKILLKYVNYTFNLVGFSPENPVFPPPDGQLYSVKINIIDSNNNIIDSRIFTNTQNATYINTNYFVVEFNPDYLTGTSSDISYTYEILQGVEATGSNQNIVGFNCIYDYIS